MGDGNNITHSWLRLAAKLNLDIVCACPEGYEPDQATLDLANAGAGRASVSHDVMEVCLCLLSTAFFSTSESQIWTRLSTFLSTAVRPQAECGAEQADSHLCCSCWAYLASQLVPSASTDSRRLYEAPGLSWLAGRR